MANLDNPQTLAADDLATELLSALGVTTTADSDLRIQDLDQCSDVTPAWTYCG